MTIESGRAFLLKIGNGANPPAFETVAGLRATALSINSEVVDVTHKNSGGWRELLSGAGHRSVALSGAGVFTDSTAEQRVRSNALSGDLDTYQVVFESGDRFEGQFLIASLEYSGDHNGERTYSLSLQSSGAIMHIEAA
ncbi:MAG: phage major tail protein, TP901-1 family [Pseudomonadota bacterium]